MAVTCRYAVLALVVVAGCKGIEEFPERLDAEGDPCHTAQDICYGQALFQCIDRTWVALDCAEHCQGQPLFVSGTCTPSGWASTPAYCTCEPPDPEGCSPGATRCDDGETVAKCDEDQMWVATSCESVCDAEGFDASLGCDPGLDQFDGIDPFDQAHPVGLPHCRCG